MQNTQSYWVIEVFCWSEGLLIKGNECRKWLFRFTSCLTISGHWKISNVYKPRLWITLTFHNCYSVNLPANITNDMFVHKKLNVFVLNFNIILFNYLNRHYIVYVMKVKCCIVQRHYLVPNFCYLTSFLFQWF